MRPARLLILVSLGCHPLDVVPVLQGSRCAEPRDAFVGCVLDGDTFEVGSCGGESIRLLGIQAPEIAHNAGEVAECYGNESAAAAQSMLLGETVRLEFDEECSDTYGRTLAYAWLDVGVIDDPSDDRFLNRDLILGGYARVYEDFDNISLADLLYTAEYAAEDAGVGLWSACE